MATSPGHPIHTAVLLAVGSELTVGETRDTNTGELARTLSIRGVDVAWIAALPDVLETVTWALRSALEVADLVVTTGGLGPTPDDLTRESIAAVCGETPAVDRELERWLRHLFERRGVPFHETNIKQAWLIPSAEAIPNHHGTAPGWWIERPDGPVIVALPGPPREMTAMWRQVLGKLENRGLGRERVTRTYRLTGIGESAVAAALGEKLLRAANPIVATYARADAVDVRITAVPENGRAPAELVDEAATAVLAAVGDHVWGREEDTWTAAIGRLLEASGGSVALVEAGTSGATLKLLGEASWLRSAQTLADGTSDRQALPELAESARRDSGASIGLAVRAVESGDDTAVELAAVGPWGTAADRSTAFLGGSEGRRRAGVAAAAFLHRLLRTAEGDGSSG
jgi:nicotinamide-nucleotide amidase